MNFEKRTVAVEITLFTALVMPVCMTAQDSTTQSHKHHHYKLIDLGTFGGPKSFVSNPDAKDLNNRGTVQGWAHISVPDPYYPNSLRQTAPRLTRL